jgi:methylase of polypeptide subunit release factors
VSALKLLVKRFDESAQVCAPRVNFEQATIRAWAKLHGWQTTDAESQLSLLRQVLLDSAIRQIRSADSPELFSTPLESLNVIAPLPLVDAVREVSHLEHSESFNFWGELYQALIPQSKRREIGQFWTDEIIADWMVSWLLQFKPARVADVGCGAGNFLLKISQRLQPSDSLQAFGYDISPLLLNLTSLTLQERQGKAYLICKNYLDEPLGLNADAAICNPPYTRHHQIPSEIKDSLQSFFKRHLGLDVSRQATLAFYFLLKLIAELPEGAHLAAITPMQVLDARYGNAMKRVLCQHTTLKALIHFAPEMNAFHKVDVGATIILLQKGHQKGNDVSNLTLKSLPTTRDLLACLKESQSGDLEFGTLVRQPQDSLLEVSKWFNISTPKIAYPSRNDDLIVPLKKLAKVVRGIATGANEFFSLTPSLVSQYNLEPYVVRTLQRNRDIQDILLDEPHWQGMAAQDKPVWLLYLNGDEIQQRSLLHSYLEQGEAQGYSSRSLVQTRRKWYAMEHREIPSIFFTILTRGNPRFILNKAGVRPLNMFSLIYPNHWILDAGLTEILWVLLNCQFSTSQLHSVSRTYGGKTLKVEPRELDNLPVINPLVLPIKIKEQITNLIDEFFSHRQSSLLIAQVNALVDDLLARDSTSYVPSEMPVQIKLLEGTENKYATSAPPQT